MIEFDAKIAKYQIPMIRYADDLLLFFKTKNEAQAGEQFVKTLLDELQLSIPRLAEGSKTKIVSRSDALLFLGREIVYSQRAGCVVAKIPAKQITKITGRLVEDYGFKKRVAEGKNFQETVVDLSKSLSAYLGIYKDAYNFKEFADELRGQGRLVITGLFQEIFGADSISRLSVEGRKFLGIQILDSITPNNELDV